MTTLDALIGNAAAVIVAHADELTKLDSAIGDGDHGANMKRGFEAVVADLPNHDGKPAGEVLKAAGMKLVMTVGGASGPLFGTLLMTLGKELGETVDREAVTAAFGKAIEAVMARGKSERGQKTMLDVLIPVHEALAGGADLAAISQTATDSAGATIPMLATKGRASFLGERSIGHMDPGARSTELIVASICTTLENG